MTTLKEEEDARDAQRTDTSQKAGELVSPNPNVPVSRPQLPPADITKAIDLSGELNCDHLISLQNYNEFNVCCPTLDLRSTVILMHGAVAQNHWKHLARDSPIPHG